MSFHLSRITQRSSCDKCKQEIAPNTGIEFYQGSRRGNNIIHLHSGCLYKALKALDRRIAKEESAPASLVDTPSSPAEREQ